MNHLGQARVYGQRCGSGLRRGMGKKRVLPMFSLGLLRNILRASGHLASSKMNSGRFTGVVNASSSESSSGRAACTAPTALSAGMNSPGNTTYGCHCGSVSSFSSAGSTLRSGWTTPWHSWIRRAKLCTRSKRPVATAWCDLRQSRSAHQGVNRESTHGLASCPNNTLRALSSAVGAVLMVPATAYFHFHINPTCCCFACVANRCRMRSSHCASAICRASFQIASTRIIKLTLLQPNIPYTIATYRTTLCTQ